MKKIIKGFRNFFFKTYAKTFITVYALFAIIGGFLLWLPISRNGDVSFGNALFLSISSMSATGLTPVNITDTFNLFGIIIIILMMEIGSFGLVMFLATYKIFTGKKVTLKERGVLAVEQSSNIKGIVKFVKRVVITLFIMQLVGIIFFMFYFYFRQPFATKLSFGESLLQGVVTTISLFANTGLDVFSNHSTFQVFLDNKDYVVIVVSMIFIFIGGVGYLPISEFVVYIRSKIKKEKYKISLISKIFFYSHIAIWLVGSISFFLMEKDNILVGYNIFDKIVASSFFSMSLRSAGFLIVPINNMKDSTYLWSLFMMFIGGSPNSTSGGIRTTTLIILFSALISFAFQNNQTMLGKKAIKEDSVKKAFLGFTSAVVLVMTVIFLISITNPNLAIKNIIFEVVSAFGTTGVSLGVTEAGNWFSKILLSITMFLGRVGIITLLVMFEHKGPKNDLRYSEIDLVGM